MEKFEWNGRHYQMMTDYKEGWNEEAFCKRYSEILVKYDYIVGDWGYGQLRLKGFFEDQHERASRETKISYLQEYLNEFCNFDCAYFVLKKTATTKKTRKRPRRKPAQQTTEPGDG
jgi:uncharacterized protein YutD